MYTYAWYHWLTFFYIYCFFGWIFESAYVSLRKGHFVNRGFLRLPMLPLYGTGAVMMLWVSLPVQDHLALVYISGVIAATLLEYVTGWSMERLFKVKYWDYSNQHFNLNGYICLSSSIAWGFLTILMTEVIHRPIERMVLSMSPALESGLLAFVTVLFVYDTIHSTRDALDLARALEAATRLRGELDQLQVQLALLKAETEQHLQELKEEQEERVRSFKAEQEALVRNVKEAGGERVRAILDGSEERVRALRDGSSEKVRAIRDGGSETMRAIRDGSSETVRAIRTGSEERLQALLAEFEEKRRTFQEAQDARVRAVNDRLTTQSAGLQQLLKTHHHWILRRNPSASSRRFAEALKELRDMMKS